MELRSLTSSEMTKFCHLIHSPHKGEFLITISFKSILTINNDIFHCPEFEIVCNLQKKLEFSPMQRKNITVTTTFLKDSTMFSWFIRKNDYNEANQKTEFEDILNCLTISYRCLEN